MPTPPCPRCHGATLLAMNTPYCPNCGWNRDAALTSTRSSLLMLPVGAVMSVPVFYDRENLKRQIAYCSTMHEIVT
jgi:hypothetical protein